MIKSQKGSLTIFFALLMLSFVMFCLVLIEGARMYFLKVKTEQAMELSEFSVLSEYQYELLQHYGLFFLDLDYQQGEEQPFLLKQRVMEYLEKNAGEVRTKSVSIDQIKRATDGSGQAFFDQAVAYMKVQSGYFVLEDAVEEFVEEPLDLKGILKEKEDALTDFSIPHISFPTIGILTKAVLGAEQILSEKYIHPEERIGSRKLQKGTGETGKRSLLQMQLFHGYLFDKFYYYGSEGTDALKEVLEYQLEYIIAGEESDRKNLENVMWRIFLLRAGGNYLFYHQDGKKLQETHAKAVTIAGFTADPVLIELVGELLLVSEAIESGISETRKIFRGEKVPLYEGGIFSGKQFGYREYLYLFLNTMNESEKIIRSMDIAELEIRKKSGYDKFRFDHCTDDFEAEWSYQFDSLLQIFPLPEGNGYENTIKRNMKYEL